MGNLMARRKMRIAFLATQIGSNFCDIHILCLLVTILLLGTACNDATIPISSEPAAVPTTSVSSNEYVMASPASVTQLSVGQHLRFDHISTEQGLSQVTVFSILQDLEGFMWFGTEDGLNRYDGYNFEVYKHDPEDPNSLSDSRIISMIQDRSGHLWIGTANGGLNKFDPGANQVTRYQNDPDDSLSLSNNRVLSLFEDHASDIWVGTENGLNRLVRGTETFIHYQKDNNDPHSLVGNSVQAIYQDQDGNLWIGTDEGLNRYDPDSDGFAHFQNDPNNSNSLSHNSVRAIFQDSEGSLWIGTDSGLNKLESGSERFIQYKEETNVSPGLNSNEIASIFEDQSGLLWIGTIGGGLNYYDRESEIFINYQNDSLDPSSLSNNFVISIFQDREGGLWFGTRAGGLNRLDINNRVFAHYQNDPNNLNSVSDNWVRSFYEDQSGAIWIGTGGVGLNRFDPENEQFTHYENDPSNPDSLSDNYVSHIRQDSLGLLWIGTGSGIDKLDPDTGIFTHYQHDPNDPSSLSENNHVMLVVEDKNGELWVATNGGGLNRFNRETETFTRYLHDINDPQSLIHNDVWRIVQTQDGTLWISTGGGLDRFEPETESFNHYQNDPDNPSSLSHNFVGTIFEGQDGEIWLGTIGGGLNKLDRASGKFTHFREKDGLPSDVIMGVIDDDQGNFWIFSNIGLTKFDPRTKTFQNYDETDGLPFRGFNGGAYLKSRSGKLYAGGPGGFIAFHPDDIRDNSTIPPVVITAISQGGQEIPIEITSGDLPEITFKWPDDSFEFEFSALSFAHPEQNQYAYYLEGYEETWNEVGSRRFGQYTHLPGGTYTLHVKGSNNDGVWNEVGTSVKITVVPPFWATWWFRGFVLLVALGVVFSGYRLRVRSLEKRGQELESQVEERTAELMQIEEVLRHSEMEKAVADERNRLARDLHDSVTQSLFAMTLYADAAARLLSSEQVAPAAGNVNKLRQTAREALSEMRLLVFELRPLVLEQEGLVAALEARLEAVETRAGLETELVVEGESHLSAGIEDALYRVAQESLNNALKHARAENVIVRLRFLEQPECVILEITDDGVGFDTAVIPEHGGLGLPGMVERVEKVEGQLSVSSKLGAGTTVTVQVETCP